ncbi:MAG: hypothetical protein C4319_08260 [Acidimicrobiia bacterium]
MAIPLRDDLYPRKIPFVTLAIIVINTAIWIFWEPTFRIPQPVHVGPVGNQVASDTHQNFLLINAAIPCELVQRRPLVVKEVRSLLEKQRDTACIPKEKLGTGGEYKPVFPNKKIWLSPLLSMFFHGNLAHLFGNMLILLILGNNVEDKLGHLRYLFLYLGGGAIAEVAHVASNPYSITPAIGASGAIAAVIGSFLVFFPFARVLTLITFPIPLAVYLPAFAPILFWFVLQFTPIVGSNVAVWAHIGGFAAGVLTGPLLYATIRPPRTSPLPRGPVWVNTRPIVRF